jgi:hypothetical protein
MSINLLETVQQNLGYPPLQKIDTTTGIVVKDEDTPAENKFSQAAIPAILTAMYRYVQSDKNATSILENNKTTNWVAFLFDDNRKEAIQTIAAYAQQSNEDPIAKMNEIANEAVRITNESLADGAGIKEVKLFFSNQKSNILLYLPPALHMGELLHDNTLDDNTNKMEGPISSLMNSIGSAFSTPVTEDELKSN